jgi:predicted HicB family RNase H-like nuclease
MPKISNLKKSNPKILTGFRLDSELKALAVKAATSENRSLSNYIENLIRKDVSAEVSGKSKKNPK